MNGMGEPAEPPKRPRRPRWSAKSSFLYALCLTGIVTTLVLAIGKRSIWVELELAVGILAACFFIFLSYVLYHGVEMDESERFEFAWLGPDSSLLDFPDLSDLDASDIGGDDLLGCLGGVLVGILGFILFAILFPILLWLGINLFLATLAVFILPMFYLYRRSLRHILRRGRRCRRRLGRAVGFAAVYTLIGSAWIYAILFAAWTLALRQGLAKV